MRGTRVQHNPKSSSYQAHRVHSTVTCRKQSGLPREIRGASHKGLSLPQGGPIAPRKSAEGIVVGGQARLVRHSNRKGERQIGRSRKSTVERPNGATAEWLLQMGGVSSGRRCRSRVRMD